MLRVNDVAFETTEKRAKRSILHDISFSVRSGELLVITGPNGSGKSTLAKIIAGIEKPTTGKIIFDGQDLSEKDCAERAKSGIAYSFQQPVHFKGLTVADLLNIATGGTKPEPSYYLKKVGLEPEKYLDREVNNSLSGGELKRIEIASVLARKAPLTIFDEPEAGIDLWSFRNLMKVFKSLHSSGDRRAMIIISHQRRIMELADRILILKGGKIQTQGASAKILSEMEDAA
ncbi:ATP-binding cassette domain-containing protein [Candidatus Saccharibacteria bacterium]|nr:ATP-binding cassette domain-containing protein [Candidatus Saccharibacteria bacterium]